MDENNGITTLTYKVEANVGGKIAQVGSRLIDMTAKKMADIFFGKFNELISAKNIKSINTQKKIIKEKKSVYNKKKIYIFGAIIILLAIYLTSKQF